MEELPRNFILYEIAHCVSLKFHVIHAVSSFATINIHVGEGKVGAGRTPGGRRVFT